MRTHQCPQLHRLRSRTNKHQRPLCQQLPTTSKKQSIQDPLTRLKPNRLNTLLDGSDQDVSLCSINQQGRGITNMLFKSVLGNSLTQQFNIPSDHNYIRLKFNSALFSSNSYTQTLSLLINIVPTSNLRTFLLS